MLGFETLTLCPIDRRLVVPALLSGEELEWLNAYHARVLEAVSPLLETQEQMDWLIKATAPIEAA